ncbi:MAG TPA: class I SAM-dependent methyltransferase [Candidatus Nitrosopolaris sp.]|nr:class I SAM-dependent methyltransferase [Candidatus Nitrosopolaris sp.]
MQSQAIFHLASLIRFKNRKGIILTPALLERAKEEAALAGLIEGIEWKHGDAEDLPFPDNSFDIVFSSVGHMFAPRPTVAAEEIMSHKGWRPYRIYKLAS